MRGAGAALVRNFLPSSALLGALESADFGQLDQRLRDRIELERLRNETEKDRAELKDLAARLASHAEQPAPDDLDPDALAAFARKAEEKEREAATHFNPVIAALKGKLRPPHDKFEADVQQLLRDGIEVLEGWLALYHGLSEMFVRQAAEKRSSAKLLRARPVKDEIDYGELSREHIARYPRIRAALAE
jgi:hypothetical protein